MSHWYAVKDGSPQYTIKDKAGKSRDTTLRDARKLNLVPSVTTIISSIAKPGLDKWKAEQTVFASFSEDRQKEGEDWDTYVKRIIYASQNLSRKASDRGTVLHDALEQFYLGKLDIQIHPDKEFLYPVIQAVQSIGTSISWDPERSFAHPLGFGGKVDLSSTQNFILDFKTKNTDDKKKFYKYEDHVMQVAAYRIGLGLPTARCFDLYVSTIKPDLVELHEWSEDELQRGWSMFLNLVEYWKLANKFGGSHD